MKTFNDYTELAVLNNLKCGHVTGGKNGYPAPYLGAFVYDFDTYAQAEQFQANRGGVIALCKQKDGWDVFEKHGEISRPLTADDYVKDLGDNYGIAQIEEVNRELSYEDHESETILELEFLKTKLEQAKETEVVIQHGYEYYDTIEKEMMSYHEDVTTWTVGVFFDRQTEQEEEN